MTRSVIAELFSKEQAQRHLEIIRRELLFTDGVRLMSDPVRYKGGKETWFKRADTAANFGREIGLQYVHAHLRYAEALAKVGDGQGLWQALQVVNPVALPEVVPLAMARQSNVYFSSSDADFTDRIEAVERWGELREGRVPVRGGWRLYSSGPGLFLHTVRSCLLGIREHYDDIVFDPVLPRALDGLEAELVICSRKATVRFRISRNEYAPYSLVLNGKVLQTDVREHNPYRTGGLKLPKELISILLGDGNNHIEIEL
jgi:CRISPR-associated protein Csx3